MLVDTLSSVYVSENLLLLNFSTASAKMGVPPLVRLQAYIEPLFLLGISVFYFPMTLLSHPFLPLVSPSTFRAKWFENFWRVIGPKMAANEVQVEHIGELLSRAHGKVLEVGPGWWRSNFPLQLWTD